jgi:hypothetical protein
MAGLFKDLVASDTHAPTALGNERHRRRVMRAFRISEISGVDHPAQAHARAVIMKRHDDAEVEAAFNASGEGPVHDRLWRLYDNENRGHPFRSADENFANAWRSLRPVERDEIRGEESGEAQRREAEEAARVQASVDDLGKSVDISALADFALRCRADAIRKTHPRMTKERAFLEAVEQHPEIFRAMKLGKQIKEPAGLDAFRKAAEARAAKMGVSVAAAKVAIVESRDPADIALWRAARP